MNKSAAWISVAVAMVVATAAQGSMFVEDQRPAASGTGMRVYVSPKTGQFEAPPAGAAADTAGVLTPAFSTTGEGLAEIPGETEAEGVSVGLGGRFHSIMTITIGADGGTATHCEQAAPPAR